jgi:RimJ/RimL family protein N-acetyltransferase
MSNAAVTLHLMTRDDLPLVTPWFADPDTSRFLGGPDWPLGCWTTAVAASARRFAAPSRQARTTTLRWPATRRSDISKLPDLSAVELFEAGVEPDNHAARRALQAAGFRPRSVEPDCEGMLYYHAWATDREAKK